MVLRYRIVVVMRCCSHSQGVYLLQFTTVGNDNGVDRLAVLCECLLDLLHDIHALNYLPKRNITPICTTKNTSTVTTSLSTSAATQPSTVQKDPSHSPK